jgi:hypothetical protein
VDVFAFRSDTPIDPISVIGDAFDFPLEHAQRRRSCEVVSVNLAFITVLPAPLTAYS